MCGQLIEPLREVKDLHLTRVRNENAYYCCTAQLMTTMPRERAAPAPAAAVILGHGRRQRVWLCGILPPTVWAGAHELFACRALLHANGTARARC